MHKTRIGKRIFALLMAQALVVSTVLAAPLSANAASSSEDVDKEEVVYVITDGEGEVDHVIVSDKLKNTDGSSIIEDMTDLTDIENVKGDETYTEGSDDSISWDSQGNDISYQGNSDKDLPVDVKISYTLDGKKISASELAGKSGKVTIRFDYTNKEKTTVKVNGKNYSVYVPFTMVSGAILDSEKFSNVKVENGKTITEGDKIIVVGYAMPGLKESLDISSDIIDEGSLDFPEYVEVTADVEDFELNMTMTAAVNDLFNDVDSDKVDSSDIESDMDDLEEGTNTLVDGTKDLADGTSTAYDGAKTLALNMNKLATGADTIEKAIGQYTNGVDLLYSKVPTLTNGVSTLNTGASKLATGAASLKTGTDSYVAGVNSLANGLLGDGSDKNPGYLKGVEQLAAGAKQLSGLSKLGDVYTAIKVMGNATSTDKTYTDLSGNTGATLGYGADVLVSSLDQMIEGAEALNSGVSGQSLKQLASGLSQANTAIGYVEQKVDGATKIVSGASQAIDAAKAETEEQASKIDAAKTTLKSAKEDINEQIDDRNSDIKEKNSEIVSAQKETNKNIDSSIDSSVNALKEAKAKLEKLQKETEGVDFEDQISAIEDQISELQNSKDHVEVTENAVEKLSDVDTSIDTESISSAKLEGIKGNLDKCDLSAIEFSQEKAGISQISSAISSAADKMGEDPVGDLITNLKKIRTGANQLSLGIASLHSSLETLETSTKSFPEAAEGITALNKGFATLTANNGTLRTGANALVKNGSSLKQGAKEVADGTSTLSDGTSTLNDGAKTLSQGVGTLVSNNKDLNDGAKTLASGADQLAKGTDSLEEGMNKLLEGAEALRDGMEEYKEEGIQKLIDLYNDDVAGLGDRLEAIQTAGQEYQTYTQLAKGKTGSVKFIYKSDEIKVDDDEE